MVWCILPGIQQMLAHHAHHHHQPIYNMDADIWDLTPPPCPPNPPCQWPPDLPGVVPPDPALAARERWAEPARMAAAPAARGSSAEPARITQEPQTEPARGVKGATCPAEARNHWVRDCVAIANPLGRGAFPLVMKVYEWLSWARPGTTRRLRNRPLPMP